MARRFMNKAGCIAVVNQTFDMARQMIWRWDATKTVSKKRAEQMLSDMEAAHDYLNVHLHNVFRASEAHFVLKIREDGTVLLGHKIQAVYFSLNWEDIHQMSKDIKDFEADLLKRRAEEAEAKERQKQKNIADLKELLQKETITQEEYDRYIEDIEKDTKADEETKEDLKHHEH